MDFKKFMLFLAIPMLALCISCGDDPEADPTCSDGIQNQGESGVDCGDPCPACTGDKCSDGIQNQDEDDIDCGGANCEGCIAAGLLYANVNGAAWESNTENIVTGSNLSMTFDYYPNPSVASYTRIQIVTSPDIQVGAVTDFVINYLDTDQISKPHNSEAGDPNNSLNIIKAGNGQLSGSFQADVKFEDANGAQSVIQIRNGQFRNIAY